MEKIQGRFVFSVARTLNSLCQRAFAIKLEHKQDFLFVAL